MNPLASVKALWNNPKKRPWIIAGGGAAATAGILAMRKPIDPVDQVAEETAAQTTAPVGGDTAYPEYQYGGTLPPVYALGGMGGDFDPGMAETDLSGIWGELDNLAAAQETAIGAAITTNREALRAQSTRQRARTQKVQQKVQKQQKTIRQTRRQVARLQNRVAKVSAPRPKAKARSTTKAARR